MTTLSARAEWLIAELEEGRRIAAKNKPIKKKEKNPRKQYDKDRPLSTTLHDWVMTASGAELFGLLVRNRHPGEFLQCLSVVRRGSMWWSGGGGRIRI
jgi:hypothetical protein